MATFTSVATVSYRYYDKRNRSVAEGNILIMSQTLGKPAPDWSALHAMPKADLIRLVLNLHAEFPE